MITALWLRLLFGTYVEAETMVTTVHSAGFANSEAQYQCGNELEVRCAARMLGRPAAIGYASPTCSDDDELVTCDVVCWGNCAELAE